MVQSWQQMMKVVLNLLPPSTLQCLLFLPSTMRIIETFLIRLQTNVYKQYIGGDVKLKQSCLIHDLIVLSPQLRWV